MYRGVDGADGQDSFEGGGGDGALGRQERQREAGVVPFHAEERHAEPGYDQHLIRGNIHQLPKITTQLDLNSTIEAFVSVSI